MTGTTIWTGTSSTSAERRTPSCAANAAEGNNAARRTPLTVFTISMFKVSPQTELCLPPHWFRFPHKQNCVYLLNVSGFPTNRIVFITSMFQVSPQTELCLPSHCFRFLHKQNCVYLLNVSGFPTNRIVFTISLFQVSLQTELCLSSHCIRFPHKQNCVYHINVSGFPTNRIAFTTSSGNTRSCVTRWISMFPQVNQNILNLELWARVLIISDSKTFHYISLFCALNIYL